MKKEAIIVAGGIGKRMGADIPKQFLRIRGEVILMRTIRLFHEFDSSIKIIVTLPGNEIKTWESIRTHELFSVPHKIVRGGKTRFHSVKNALKEVSDNSAVAIHDGVRPLVSKEIIANAYREAESSGSAIPVIDIYESVRYVSEQENYPVPRQNYKLVQTPQVFLSNIIQSAYQTDYREEFTDDASVLEHTGKTVNLIKGNPENIKITTKKDLAIAETLLDFI